MTILTGDKISEYYRFFGTRDGILQFGHLIKFIEENSIKDTPKMRSISLIEFPWLRSRDKRLLWGEWLRLFYSHLKDKKSINTFYFNLLLLSVQKWDKSDRKRIICESYINILQHENRVSPLDICTICKEPIKEHLSLINEFKPVHPKCIKAKPIPIKKIINFFNTKNSIFLDDKEIDRLFKIIMRGF